MPHFVVSATGQASQTVEAVNWLAALGQALEMLGLTRSLERLACEILPNESVVCRDVKTGMGFVVMPTTSQGATDEASGEAYSNDNFGVRNLPAAVFQANLAHDLRTPLNSILGYAGMMAEEAEDHNMASLAKDARLVSGEAAVLLELLESGLESNRLTWGDLDSQTQEFSVDELLDDVVAAFQLEVVGTGNTLKVDGAGESVTMCSDPTFLRDVLLECMRWSNGRVEKGTITLSAAVEGEDDETWVTFEVSDTGAPLDDAERAGLFTVYASTETVSGAAARAIRRGTARELCRRLGGDLQLKSAPQERSALSIRIPQKRTDD